MIQQSISKPSTLYIYRRTAAVWNDRNSPQELFGTKMERNRTDALPLEQLLLSFGILPDERHADPFADNECVGGEQHYAGVLALPPGIQEKFGKKIRFVLGDKLDERINLADIQPEDTALKIVGMEFGTPDGAALSAEENAELNRYLMVTAGEYLGEGEMAHLGSHAAAYVESALRRELPFITEAFSNSNGRLK